MIKNIKEFLKESEKKKRNFLKKLSISKSARILENLISSKILQELISKPKEPPLSLEKSLKHAKLSR